MGAGLRRCSTPREVFDIIADAKRAGVPIVPLIGAGLSLEGGVPTTGLMVDYMAKVKLLIDLELRRDGEDLVYADRLKTMGWPDPSNLNKILLERLKARIAQERTRDVERRPKWLWEFIDPEESLVRSSGSLLGAVRLFILHQYLQTAQPSLLGFVSGTGMCPVTGELERVLVNVIRRSWMPADGPAPEMAAAISRRLKDQLRESGLRDRILKNLALDWRAMLRLLTSGIPALIDSFFDRLVRGHSPATGHQFLALMAESLDCRLWLTTNFDDLIERALREQRIDPVVFELPDSGPVPDHTLFANVPSVVKLHGSGYALRVGESLDVPLDHANLDVFKDYFPADAIVLVIGYGGGDWRVMSLIEHLIIHDEFKKLPKVLWVYRDRLPASVKRVSKGLGKPEETRESESVWAVRYQSGGFFLRELYERLTGSHAASRVTYNALPMLPSRPVEGPEPSETRREAGNAGPAVAGNGREAHPGGGSLSGREAPEALESSVTIIHGFPSDFETSARLIDRVRPPCRLPSDHLVRCLRGPDARGPAQPRVRRVLSPGPWPRPRDRPPRDRARPGGGGPSRRSREAPVPGARPGQIRARHRRGGRVRSR